MFKNYWNILVVWPYARAANPNKKLTRIQLCRATLRPVRSRKRDINVVFCEHCRAGSCETSDLLMYIKFLVLFLLPASIILFFTIIQFDIRHAESATNATPIRCGDELHDPVDGETYTVEVEPLFTNSDGSGETLYVGFQCRTKPNSNRVSRFYLLIPDTADEFEDFQRSGKYIVTFDGSSIDGDGAYTFAVDQTFGEHYSNVWRIDFGEAVEAVRICCDAWLPTVAGGLAQ